MRTIRRGVFETNSSSTHSLTILSKEEFDKWVNGEVFFHDWDEKLITKEEALKEIDRNKIDINNKDELEKELASNGIYSYESYGNNEDYNYYEENHTTKSGDNIVVFGKYGYNG